jgi:predicted membrane-bound spermidine synthase
MAHEILSFKLIKPYLGSSIYVWTSVLSATLAGLALGYFLGARFSGKTTLKKTFLILISTSVLLMILPYYSQWFLQSTIELDLKTNILINAGIIIIPIMILLGMYSPLIIQQINSHKKNNGNSTGSIYSISTVGGIIFALICSLFTIPIIGVKQSYLFSGLILLVGSATCFYFLRNRLHEK